MKLSVTKPPVRRSHFVIFPMIADNSACECLSYRNQFSSEILTYFSTEILTCAYQF